MHYETNTSLKAFKCLRLKGVLGFYPESKDCNEKVQKYSVNLVEGESNKLPQFKQIIKYFHSVLELWFLSSK